MKVFFTILMLTISNIFMTFAWYGHLKFSELKFFKNFGIFETILFSWGIAFFEYCIMVPANKTGFSGNNGPFSLVELKVIQEVITLLVFLFFTLIFFKNEQLKWNHFVGLILLVCSVYFVFKK